MEYVIQMDLFSSFQSVFTGCLTNLSVTWDHAHALLTCFAVLGHALALSSRINRNHRHSVDCVRLQILQHSAVGAARYLHLYTGMTHTYIRLRRWW